MSTVYGTQAAHAPQAIRGFSLVEVLVAFTLLSITLVVTLNLFVTIISDRPVELRTQQVTRTIGAIFDDIMQEVRVSERIEYGTLNISGSIWREIRLYRKENVNQQATGVTAYRWKELSPNTFYKITDLGTADEIQWLLTPSNVQIDKFVVTLSKYTNPVTLAGSSLVRLRLSGFHTEAGPGEEGGLVQTSFAVRII